MHPITSPDSSATGTTRKIKLPRMRIHDLRHSCATLLLSKGVHPRVVMEILGHSTIAMTMNVYSHVVPEIAIDAANAMESVFANQGHPIDHDANTVQDLRIIENSGG